jgi:hypothetical protein
MNIVNFGAEVRTMTSREIAELTAFLKAYASGMISLPEGMLQEGNTENEETEGYEDEA